MPYCSQCGGQIRDADAFCGLCGGRQPVSAASAVDGISPRTASILCYIPVMGWIPAVIALASGRFRRDADVRFHAFQGIYLFVVWLIVDWILSPAAGFSMWRGWARHWEAGFPALTLVGAMKAAVFVAWIFMLVKTSKGEHYRLPILGELADRSVAEQK
jgi:uncharacterized membrane protein